MICFLNGKYIIKTPTYVWIEVNGIGYEVNISLNTYSQIQHLQSGILYTHLQIKEDAHTLFGFFEEEERNLFLHLITVSGIGASTARMMLSSMKPDEIHQAIVTENELLLSKIKGIGPKSAKRLILELKEKLIKNKPIENMPLTVNNKIDSDALNALISLGIARNTAYNAIQKVLKTETNIELETLIKLSLKNI
ncbi:MAG TPA: Holliday junction branch migration protein RuvA [Chitinophagaceae bacterium]|nr:MAG: Holliday junction DNA helicase subunit RuvA [Bacteroidetes bacterium OLB11]HMN33346.1 Holliday junction branch migration protein RuvA [Chitinophagaceae bacterium]